MNYLTELLAFYRWMAESRLSPLLQAYWHLLMYTNNRAAIGQPRAYGTGR